MMIRNNKEYRSLDINKIAVIGYLSGLLLIISLLLSNSKFATLNYFLLMIVIWVIGLMILVVTLDIKKLSFTQFLFSGFVLGMAIQVLFASYYIRLWTDISFLIALLLGLILTFHIVHIKCEKEFLFITVEKKEYIVLILIFLLAFLIPLDDVLNGPFYTGWDPWITKPIVKYIAGEGPFRDYFPKAFLGFYNYIVIQYLVLGDQIFYFLKFYGPIFLSLSSIMVFFIAERITTQKYAVVSPIVFLSGAFLIKRFTMPIRENLAFVFLLCVIFLLTILLSSDENRNLRSLIKQSVPVSILIASIFMTHLLTYAICILSLLYLIFFMVIKRNNLFWAISFQILFSVVLVLNEMKYFGRMISWSYTTFGTIIFIFFISSVLFYFFVIFLSIRGIINHRHILGISILFIIGSLYSLTHSLGTGGATLGTYNPPVTLDKFSAPLVFLGTLGGIFSLLQRNFENKYPLYSLLLTLITLLNITNFGLEFANFRLIIYITVVFSTFSPVILEKINNLKKQKILFTTAASVLVLITINSSVNVSTSHYFQPKHFEIVDFIGEFENEECLILPQWRSHFLFDFYGKYYDYSLASDLLNSHSKVMVLKKIREKYPSKNCAYLIIFYPKWVEKEILDLLNKNFQKREINGVIIYKILIEDIN